MGRSLVFLVVFCIREIAALTVDPVWDRRTALATATALAFPTSIDDNLRLRNTRIPRIGYSLYKTAPEQVEDGVKLAYDAGVRLFDVATQYGTNELVAPALKGRSGVCLAHKISNAEQSIQVSDVQESVMQTSALFGQKLNLVMLHSPLTDSERRVASYRALVELQQQKKIGAVGVCNFGVKPLQELVDAGLPPPAVIQLILSPFNQHKDIAEWARVHGSVLSCSAWSKLSSVEGPQQGWAVVSDMAKEKGVTKQQILIRWALQSGYLCAPRSGSKFKVEREAIVENAPKSIRTFELTREEMAVLNRLDEGITAGKLGIYDGWDPSEIVDDKWDPTLLD